MCNDAHLYQSTYNDGALKIGQKFRAYRFSISSEVNVRFNELNLQTVILCMCVFKTFK